MTIHIQMLQDIATHARAMADSMQAIVDDSCVGFAGFPRRWVRFGWEPKVANRRFARQCRSLRLH